MRSGDEGSRTFVQLCVAGLTVAAALTAWWIAEIPKPVHAVEMSTAQADRDVRIGVMGLFHPQELRLYPTEESDLEVTVDGHSLRLARNSEAVAIRLRNNRVEVQFSADSRVISGAILRASSGVGGTPGGFWLEVPGKLKRRYVGRLEIHAHGSQLETVVTMPLETAVASVVAAESPPGSGFEALKAQAVAARSFLAARQAGHADFDFCDTTHCQFLRSPPAPGSAANKAARSTRGLILEWHEDTAGRDRPLAAMYARSCGGRTRTLHEAGVRSDGYPYYAVQCDYCSRHPEVWQRESKGAPRTEQERLAFNRIHGWGAVPSLSASSADAEGQIQGRGVGHGIGLCQLGAADMARQGSTFAQILAHYYPNTKLTPISASMNGN
jgi:stage II sporulation protein D